MSTDTAELIRASREAVEISRELLASSRVAALRSRELREASAAAREANCRMVVDRSRAVALIVHDGIG